jgi:peptidoglycan/LPS O-acetylase OafA/YrhL
VEAKPKQPEAGFPKALIVLAVLLYMPFRLYVQLGSGWAWPERQGIYLAFWAVVFGAYFLVRRFRASTPN